MTILFIEYRYGNIYVFSASLSLQYSLIFRFGFKITLDVNSIFKFILKLPIDNVGRYCSVLYSTVFLPAEFYVKIRFFTVMITRH